jgi:transposase
LPESYIPPEELAELRERIRRRAFLVRQRTKLKVKIRDVLAYEGIKPPTGHGLFTRKGVEWLRNLGLEPVDCYLRLMGPLSREVLLLSKELRGMARDDPDVQLLTTIPGVGYYIALLIKAEVGDVGAGSAAVTTWRATLGWCPVLVVVVVWKGMAGSPVRVAGGCGGRWWRRLWCTSGTIRW